MSDFWNSFWSNLLSNIALVVVLSAAGFLAKAKIVQAAKKFIRDQAKVIIEEEQKKDGETKA
jgi:hypothetical protein